MTPQEERRGLRENVHDRNQIRLADSAGRIRIPTRRFLEPQSGDQIKPGAVSAPGLGHQPMVVSPSGQRREGLFVGKTKVLEKDWCHCLTVFGQAVLFDRNGR